MAKDPIKKADNGTYYFRANLENIRSPESRFKNTAAILRPKKKHTQNIAYHP